MRDEEHPHQCPYCDLRFMYHSHHDAQVQVPNGMAGAFLIGDMLGILQRFRA